MRRQVTMQRFSEQEIIYLLYALAKVGYLLKLHGATYRNIKPSSVLISESYCVKLAPTGTFPFDIDSLYAQRQFAQYSYLPVEASNQESFDW